LHEPVVARLDAWVLIENACVASNVAARRSRTKHLRLNC